MTAKKINKQKTSALVYIGAAGVVLVIVIILARGVVGRLVATKMGLGALSGLIEKNTGIKTNLKDASDGTMSFTDTETGTRVDVGTGKIPDSLPKDFPLYPNATVTSTLSGVQGGKTNGIWLTLTSPDSLESVTAYYKTQLAKTGWNMTQMMTMDDGTTQTLSKGAWNGTLAMTRDDSDKETLIVIVLGEDKPAVPEPTEASPTVSGT